MTDTTLALPDVVTHFLNDINIAPSTKVSYEVVIRKFYLWLHEDKGRETRLDDFTKANVVKYRAHMEKIGKQPGTVSMTIVIFKRFAKWLADEGYADYSPLDRLQLPRNSAKPKQPLTKEEVGRLLNACETPRDKAIVAVMLDAGLRRAEVCGLTISDLNLGALQATVTGKGRKTRIVNVAFAAKYVRKWLNVRPKDVTTDGLFLGSDHNHNPLSTQGLAALFRRLGKRSGIINLHMHRLRHTMATTLYDETSDIIAIQQLLGHSDIQTTRRYLHRDPKKSLDVARQHSPMAAMMRGAR